MSYAPDYAKGGFMQKAGFNGPADVLDPGGTRRIFETQKADLSSLTDQQKAAAEEEDRLAQERAGITPDKTQQIATRGAQEAQLPALQAAAAGQVPSAAQIQGGQAAGQEAARQFAMASALKGRGSAAGALDAASAGLTANGGQIVDQAANQRAGEVAGARGLLSKATTGIRGGDLGAYGIDQASRDANLAAIIREQQIQAQNAQDIASANAAAAGYTNQKRGALVQGGGSMLMGMLSDDRAKTAKREKSMADALGREVHGVEFVYRPGVGDDDKHFGVIAQDVERAIPGVVHEGPGGLKVLSAGHLTAANTAILAELAKRIRELEKRRAD